MRRRNEIKRRDPADEGWEEEGWTWAAGRRLWKASWADPKVEEIGACRAVVDVAVAALMKALRKINEKLLEQAAEIGQPPLERLNGTLGAQRRNPAAAGTELRAPSCWFQFMNGALRSHGLVCCQSRPLNELI